MRTTHALVCVVLALGRRRPAAQKPDGASQLSREWKRLTTPSLTVVGNAREDDLRRAGLEMERFRRALGSFSSSLRLDSPVPTTVVVFRDDSAFTPFKPRFRGKVNDNVAGYFTAQPHVNYMVMAPSGQREFTMRVIFHEYTHYIVNRNFKRLPGWLNEGLADFYSTFSGSDKDGRTIVGRPIDYYVARLTTRPMMPVARFVSPAAAADLGRDIARHHAVLFAVLGAHPLPADRQPGGAATATGAVRHRHRRRDADGQGVRRGVRSGPDGDRSRAARRTSVSFSCRRFS